VSVTQRQALPVGETAVFVCPRCSSQERYWKGGLPFAKVGRSDSNIRCQPCSAKLRGTNMLGPSMVCQEFE